jgi:hypothetical protein
MFARYFVEIPLPVEHVERLLTDDPAAWLSGHAERATQRGDALLADVGFGQKVRVAREVSVTLGTPVRAGTRAIVPLRWVPSTGAGLFPALDADLEVAPLGTESTQLSISARYAPPLGAFGRAIDRVLLFRVAEATLKDFLDGVVVALASLERDLVTHDDVGRRPSDGYHRER